MYSKTEGVILYRRNFGEADRLITIYTRDFGKVTVIAKGVRRPRSKKAGHLELGSWCKLFIAHGKNLDILTEVEIKKAFGIDNFTEAKANKIYHLLELVSKLTPEHQKNQKLFNLLVNFLNHAANGEDFNLVSGIFKIKVMSNLGFFSSKTYEAYKSGEIIKILEDEDFNIIKKTVKLKKESNLKLIRFLDSIIEQVSEHELKTNRFLNG